MITPCCCFFFFFLTLYQLLAGYQTREQAIKRCINTVNENTQQLRERRDKNPDDYYAMKDLRKEQTKVRIVVRHIYMCVAAYLQSTFVTSSCVC